MAFDYYYTMEYLPTRYEADQYEWANRRAVWNFKDGNCSSTILVMLKRHVSRIIGSDSKDDYVICFIPASTKAKTLNRFGEVADELESRTGVKATLNAITKPIDTAAGHVAGKSSDPTAGFCFDSDFFRIQLYNKFIISSRDLSVVSTPFEIRRFQFSSKSEKKSQILSSGLYLLYINSLIFSSIIVVYDD